MGGDNLRYHMAGVKCARTLYTTTVRELNAQNTFMLLTRACVNVALMTIYNQRIPYSTHEIDYLLSWNSLLTKVVVCLCK